MRLINSSKTLIFYPVMLACIGLALGCRSTKHEYRASSYSGAPAPVVTDSTTGSARATSTASTVQTPNVTQGEVAIPMYEERILVGTRSVEAGGVRLRKEIVTETVNQPVQIRRETLVVDREAAPSGRTELQGTGHLSTLFEAGEIVIQLRNEEPVVETRVVPLGRLIVQTRTNSEQTTVQRQIRREKIGVVKIGDGNNVIISENVNDQPSDAVGAPPADSQRIQGQGGTSKAQGGTKEWDVQDDQGEPFPRPQPDGRLTFPELHKSSDKR